MRVGATNSKAGPPPAGVALSLWLVILPSTRRVLAPFALDFSFAALATGSLAGIYGGLGREILRAVSNEW